MGCLEFIWLACKESERSKKNFVKNSSKQWTMERHGGKLKKWEWAMHIKLQYAVYLCLLLSHWETRCACISSLVDDKCVLPLSSFCLANLIGNFVCLSVYVNGDRECWPNPSKLSKLSMWKAKVTLRFPRIHRSIFPKENIYTANMHFHISNQFALGWVEILFPWSACMGSFGFGVSGIEPWDAEFSPKF